MLVTAVTRSLPRQRGFTLVELMVTIVVLGVLLAVAVPNFQSMIRRNAVASASNSLLADMSYARTEAITRGTIVSICPSSDGVACTDSGTDYESGWLVYTYTAGHGVAATAYDDSDATNILLRATGERRNVSVATKLGDIVSFGPQGQLRPDGTSLVFDTCYRPSGSTGHGSSTGSVAGTELVVNASGGVQSSALAADADCAP